MVLGEGTGRCVCAYTLSPKLTSLGQTSPLSSRLTTACLISALGCPWASYTEPVQNEFLSFPQNLFLLQASLIQLKATFNFPVSQLKNSGIICGCSFPLAFQSVNKYVDTIYEIYPGSDYFSPASVLLPPSKPPSPLIRTPAVYLVCLPAFTLALL